MEIAEEEAEDQPNYEEKKSNPNEPDAEKNKEVVEDKADGGEKPNLASGAPLTDTQNDQE